MNQRKLHETERVTDRFIAKRLRVNKPFQSLIATDEFAAFKGKLHTAIKAQYSAVADTLRQAHMVSIANDSMIEQFVSHNMPPLSDYLTKEEIVLYLKYCFTEGVRAQYGRFGVKTSANKMTKAFTFTGGFDFDLTDPDVIAALEDSAAYLLNRSNIDGTTRQRLIDLIRDNKIGDNSTVDELASIITDEMPDIADSRAFTIARTETARAMGEGNYNAMVQNGVTQKRWVLAGGHVCEICAANADDGFIGVDESFSSGDDYEPAHPNCECYTEAGEINLDEIDLWDGS